MKRPRMRRVRVSPEMTRMLLRPRGPHGITLALLYDMRKIILHDSIRPARLAPAEMTRDVIPLTRDEVRLMHMPISRNGITLCEALGVDAQLRGDADNADCNEFFIAVAVDEETYRNALAMSVGRRVVSDIHFIETHRGDIYVRCAVRGVKQKALRVKRWVARNLDQMTDDERMDLTIRYFRDKVISHIDSEITL